MHIIDYCINPSPISIAPCLLLFSLSGDTGVYSTEVICLDHCASHSDLGKPTRCPLLDGTKDPPGKQGQKLGYRGEVGKEGSVGFEDNFAEGVRDAVHIPQVWGF